MLITFAGLAYRPAAATGVRCHVATVAQPKCPACGANIGAGALFLGRTVKCKGCGSLLKKQDLVLDITLSIFGVLLVPLLLIGDPPVWVTVMIVIAVVVFAALTYIRHIKLRVIHDT